MTNQHIQPPLPNTLPTLSTASPLRTASTHSPSPADASDQSALQALPPASHGTCTPPARQLPRGAGLIWPSGVQPVLWPAPRRRAAGARPRSGTSTCKECGEVCKRVDNSGAAAGTCADNTTTGSYITRTPWDWEQASPHPEALTCDRDAWCGIFTGALWSLPLLPQPLPPPPSSVHPLPRSPEARSYL